MEGNTPLPAWKRLKLQLRWIVYEDQDGNFVLIEPYRPKTLAESREQRRDEAPRPPMVRIGATEAEYDAALESLLWEYRQVTRLDRPRLELIERVEEARDRASGLTGRYRKENAA